MDDDIAAKFGDALCDGIPKMMEMDRFKNAKRAFLDSMWDDIQYSIIDNMPEALEGLVRDMADKAVNAMLKGQPVEVRRYLHLDGWTGRDKDHPVIHGKLHVPFTMELRAQVAKANETLLRDEVIKDLENQVASLVTQNNQQEATISRLSEKIRELS